MFVAGGLLGCLFSGRTIKDIDVYFRNRFVFNQNRVKLLAFDKWEICGYNEWSETFINDNRTHDIDIPIQFISLRFGNAIEIMRCFDFTVCQCAFSNGRFVMSKDFMPDLQDKRLTLNMNATTPNIERIERYKMYGYEWNPAEIFKLAAIFEYIGISKDDLNDLKNSEDGYIHYKRDAEQDNLASSIEILEVLKQII